ncbi:maleylacetate reductase [Rhodococcus erythropolis]|nr:maleylacetate reductase [Rhodococcus erythropolis]
MNLVFDHFTLGQRVLFGAGRAADNLAAEVTRLAAQRIMVIASQSETNVAQDVTKHIDIAVFHDDVAPHVPLDKADSARAVATDNSIDLLVSIGGGSTTGLAKAVALTTGLPIVAVPTTYAGSEATNVWGLTEAARKTTGADDKVLPVTVIYDAYLTLSLPIELSVASGLNAMAHCIDSMWAPRTDPINRTLAAEGIRALAEGLPAIKNDPQNLRGREQALYGAYLSAVAFASAGSGLHHKICHVLGGAYDMPHAQTHAAVLPYVLAFNAAAAPEAERRIATAFGSDTALGGLNALRKLLDAPRALKDYGFDAARISEAVKLILPFVPDSNPRPVTVTNLDALLRTAHAGDTPNP